MEEKITVTEQTKLPEILEAYPWLPEALIKLDKQFEKLNSPLVRMLIKRSTVADVCKRFGVSAEELIGQLSALVAAREES